ncbi:galactose-3-O-sulfotransferase 4-like [Saccoglossus kowalevskii]
MKHDTLNANLEQDYYPNPSWKNCTPYNDFVFVKTSKTGGSTVGALLYRYGIKHNLTAALPDPLTSMMLHITQVQRWFSMTSDHGLKELDKEFDLVMITEYMDESLVLLKQIMCWTFDDVIYHSNKVSTKERQPMTRPMERVLSEILVEDITVYKHFDMTLWRKIDNYDGDFDNDLRLLRARRAEINGMSHMRENNAQEHVCKFLSYDVHQCKGIAENVWLIRSCGGIKFL